MLPGTGNRFSGVTKSSSQDKVSEKPRNKGGVAAVEKAWVIENPPTNAKKKALSID
jgi:hypothetical protein